MKSHIPKVDCEDDYDFMCGTSSFGATVGARALCQSCVKKTLEIVELLTDAHDVLSAMPSPSDFRAQRRVERLVRRINKVLGKRPIVHYPVNPNPNDTEGHTP